ncbi:MULTISPECIES: nuclear transport factor 2 family protein [Streptomyces]|uniref:nuclear transport factor 2 family protein n=1 Tax=Streptomyces TaxID=1883 RepID=UPI00192C0A1E|nr:MULTISPECIES: nuclear transport factor 2 family protein [Streptomyces]MEE1731704.1 nuclear transport factor 2 family protein [Streptomyces sp. BE282]QQZ54227.1 nuclear transport factor 2 family protein [Streptomyces microflavus]WSR91466.1 nuclear transport factor 2 family protein [Streptomyces microflavus]
MGADPSRSNEPAELPTAISGYLVAHTARDTAAALATLAADAAVTDEGRTYRGHAEIGQWLTGAASEYTYTTELLGAQRTDADRWTVTQRLEGDFPGGLVDLRFQFALGGHGLIEQLVIEV